MRLVSDEEKRRKIGEKVSDLLNNAEDYHAAYYRAETFGGPSLHFHRRSLEMRRSGDFLLFLEFVYATLVSWGMHRMGGGPQMVSFDDFRKSVEPLREEIAKADRIDYRKMADSDWSLVKDLFCKIKVMASGTTIVGNSKVLAHLLPNIVPPVDREYTLDYLLGNGNIKNGIEAEWQLLRAIIEGFFIPVATNSEFLRKAENWIANQQQYPWDTSVLKVIDNLVIGTKKVD
jgi:hypothetical protein